MVTILSSRSSHGPPQITGYWICMISNESYTTRLTGYTGLYRPIPASPITLRATGDVQDYRYRLVQLSCPESPLALSRTFLRSRITDMIRWMYSGINVHGFSPIGTTGDENQMVGEKTCLRSFGHHSFSFF